MQLNTFLAGLPALKCFGHSMGGLDLAVTECLHRSLGHVAIILDELHLWGTLMVYRILNAGEILRCLTLSEPQASNLPDSAGMGSGANGGPMPLVGIKSLHFYDWPTCHDNPTREFLEYIDLLLEMLESRRTLGCGDEPGQLESLVFHVNPSSPAAISGMPIILGHWSVEQRARFDRVTEGGLRIEVKEGRSPFSSWYRPESIDSEFPCTCAGN